jgi:hypothetical protein
MSLNVQSFQVKFNNLTDLVASLQYDNCAPDIMFLKERWKIHDSSLLHLNDYSPQIYKSSCI